MKNKLSLDSIVIFTALFSLFFTMTNHVVLSPLVIVFVVIYMTVAFNSKLLKMNKIIFFIILIFLYDIIQIIFIDPLLLLNYNFYRRDGNIFISFLPIFLYFIHNKYTLYQIKRKIYLIAKYISFINIVWLLIYFILGYTLLGTPEQLYFFLFKAHNAAGGFLSILVVITFINYLESKTKYTLVISLLNMLSLYATDSRGSLLAVLGAFILVLVFKNKLNKLFLILIIIINILIISFIKINNLGIDNFNMGTNSIDNFNMGTNRDSTIAIRVFYSWPKATNQFLASPIIGTGFSTFNDSSPILYINELFAYKLPINDTQIKNNDAHAHNSYLHILAENGIIGLFLLFLILYYMNKFIKRLAFRDIYLSIMLRLILWINIISSFTENRMTTPSQILPFMIIMGLILSRIRSEKYEKSINS